MSKQAMVPCFVCGVPLDNCWQDSENQPSEGTEFRTRGHYGSTFWDDLDGEELLLNICDECLQAHTDRLMRHKRFRIIKCEGFFVGRQYVDQRIVAYFDGPSDHDPIEIEPEEIGQPNDSIIWHKSRHLEQVRECIQRMQADEAAS